MRKIITMFPVILLIALLSMTTGFAQVDVSTGGPATSYTELSSAFAAINAGTHTGAITIAISGNTTEPVSAVLNASGTGSASYTSIVISPTGGASRIISGAVTGHLVDLNGADNVTINGLNTGGNSLTISNTAAGAYSALRFIADATNNLVTNCTLLGATNASFGVVLFSSGTTTGNDNNTVSYCNIGPSGATLPLYGIYSMGTSAVIDNSAITISNNNIYDFFSATLASAGMNINSFNSAWTITGNSFYQTATRTSTVSNQHSGIFISNSGDNYVINSNYIGGSEAGATGSAWTLAGNFTNRFVGISVSAASTATTNIQGNTIRNFVVNTNSSATTANGNFSGIWVSGGNANIGTLVGNTIGKETGNGSIAITLVTNSGGSANLIAYSGAGLADIRNNTIGSIDIYGATTLISAGCQAIYVSGGTPTISGNLIGSLTTPNSIHAATVSTHTSAQRVAGILVTGTVTNNAISISSNTVANLTQAGTGAAHYIRGIFFSGQGSTAISTININNNTLFNLKGANSFPTLSSAAIGILGIGWIATTTNSIYAIPMISGNTIYGLEATNTGAVQTNVCAITATNIAGTTGVISKNRIYDLRNASTMAVATTPPTASGIYIRANPTGACTIYNNMISLGNAQTSNTLFAGIWNGFTGTLLKLYFNTVQISGTAASGALPSFGFLRGDLSVTAITTSVDIKNNIFENLRSGGTGKHYAIANDYGATASATGWAAGASNYNMLNASAANVGYWTTDQTFDSWKTASGCDANSYSGYTVTFSNPATGDLHLNTGITPTVAESGGVTGTGITNDYDLQTRPGPAGSVNGGATAPDLGADEFDGVPQDVLSPTIVYTPLLNTNLTTARTLTVTVTDVSGVPTAAPGWPYLYWKKTGAPAYTAVAPSAYLGSNQYQYAFGAGVATGDVVSYYVVARDNQSPANVGSFPSAGAGAFTYDPPAAGTPPTAPSTYTVTLAPLSGDYLVGSGEVSPYLTITAAVADLNLRGVSGPVRFLLENPAYSTAETYPIVVNVMNENLPSAANPVTIKPVTGMTTSITGVSASSQVFRIRSGYVTIDGSNTTGGTSRDLTITNSSPTAPQVIGISSAGTTPVVGSGVKNCTVVNGSTGSSAIVISATDGTAGYFSNITVQNNSIQAAFVGIYSIAVATAGNGSGLLIANNDLNTAGAGNIRLIGIYVQGFDGATVTGNNVGNMANTTDATNITGIWFATGTVNSTITGNTVSGISGTLGSPRGIVVTSAVPGANVNITGNTITNISSAFSSANYGINIFSSTSGVTVQKNRISNIKNTNTTGYSAIGLGLGSTLPSADITVKNNFFWDIAGNGWSSLITDNGYGINISSGGGYNILNNSISLSTNQVSATGNPACLIIGSTVATGSLDVRNNIFSIDATTGTNRYAVICNAAATVFSAIDHNDYFTSGSNLCYINAAPVADLAAWKTATGKDLNSVSGDAKFVSPTDLHILTGVYTPVRSAGVTIASVTDDIDGNPRTNPPDIGAAEDGYAPISLGANLFNATCPGSDNGSISTIVGGGLAPYTYLWNTGATTDGISGLIAGAYSVTVTDALGTTKTGSWTITQPEAFFLYTEITPANCPSATDGSISMAVNGGTPSYTHIWSNGSTNEDISGLAPGNYSVTVTDYVGCVTTGSWTVGILDPVCNNISVSGTASSTVCFNAHLTITVAGYTVAAPSGNATFIAGQNILFQPGTVVQSGAYMHGYISTIFCSPAKTPSAAAGQEEPQAGLSLAAFSLYPNPTSGNFTIRQKSDGDYGSVQVEIYTMSGTKVMTDRMTGERQREFNVASLPAGIYFVKLVAGGQVETIKMVRTK